MGYMDRIRSLAPWFILGVGGIFILFMVVSDMNFSQIMNDRGTVGEINGSKINIQEFETFYQNYLNRLKQSGQATDMSNEQMYRDQAWDQFVQLKILESAYKKYNITVSDDEIRNVVLGENPPEYLKKSFIDSSGVFRRAEYEAAIKDPRNKENMIAVEAEIKQQILFQKLQAIVSAGVLVTEPEMRRKFADQDIKMSADFALIDLNVYPDSTIVPTDDELKDFYSKKSYLFRQDANRKLKFVSFKIVPSAKDSAAVLTILNNVLKRIKADTVSTFQSFVEAQSEAPYSKDTFAVNTLPVALKNYKGDLKAGQVVGPLAGEGDLGIYKISGVIEGTDVFVRASHILLNKSGDDKADLEAATKLYEELKKGKNFEATAREVSKDPGSAVNGGDLGWFGKGTMVKPFEEACFNGPVGEVQAPVKTDFGYHIIKVAERSAKKMIVEKIVKKLNYSPQTVTLLRREAEDFLALAKKMGLDSAAKSKSLNAQETTPFTEEVAAVPGLGYSRNLVATAFKEGEKDFVPVTVIGDQMVVAQIRRSK
ncbi:peptidylprolyl isomerase [Ignavibacteriales bacterium]